MKYLKICFITMVIGCNSTSKKAPEMPGAYLMVSQTVNNGTTNTKFTSVKQLKIYTDNSEADIDPSLDGAVVELVFNKSQEE